VETTILLFFQREFMFGGALTTAVIVLLTVYAGSKFLHFDGLTDFGDGMIVSGEQSDHIRALKDTLVGAGGIGVALITVLCSVAFYTMYGNQALIILVFPAVEVMVKNAMVFAAALGDPGNGMAARQVELTNGASAVRGLIVSFIALCILFLISGVVINLMFGIGFVDILVTFLQMSVVGLAVSIAVGVLMARIANRTFGMVNGDILGATNEIARPVILFLVLLALDIIAVI
jgi:adenosylcobinamide-GDP ribazoletransferase